jgi:hypothetical protein
VPFTIKQGDTRPFLRATLKKASSQPIPLGLAVIRFNMAPAVAGTGLSIARASALNLEGTIDAETGATLGDGVVEYRWAPGDTAVVSIYRAEFEVTFADGTVETWPNSGYIDVEVYAGLD